MIEEVDKLEADAECGAFPTRNFRTLHDCEIWTEIVRSAKTIVALTEGHRWTIADAYGSQAPNINPVSHPGCTKTAFGPGVIPSHKVSVGIQGCGASGMAAPLPHDGFASNGLTGTA